MIEEGITLTGGSDQFWRELEGIGFRRDMRYEVHPCGSDRDETLILKELCSVSDLGYLVLKPAGDIVMVKHDTAYRTEAGEQGKMMTQDGTIITDPLVFFLKPEDFPAEIKFPVPADPDMDESCTPARRNPQPRSGSGAALAPLTFSPEV